MKASFRIVFVLAMLCVLPVCRRDMFNQPKSNPLGQSDFFQDGADSRPIPPHTVARGDVDNNEAFYTGMIGTNLVTTIPMVVSRQTLEHGRECFNVNCLPCHGASGEGNGIVVMRGFPAPPSYHIDRLRDAPIGHFFDVMTHGYGVMFPFASRVTPADRWAIADYIRALQLSQNATLADVPSNEVAQLERTE
jgi:cytochrome c553